MEESFLLFFIVLLASVFFASLFQRLHIPWVVALMIGGILIGPHALNILEINSTISFLGQLGLVFLMFMAGLETRLSSFAHEWKTISKVAVLNGGIPFVVGLGIGIMFGFDMIASLLLGIIFISSSVAIIIPTLESTGLVKESVGKTIMASTLLVDVISLVMLSVLLQSVHTTSAIPLPLTYLFLFLIIISLKWILPRLHWLFRWTSYGEGSFFLQELRAVFLVLIGTVILFGILGLHPIVAGFFAGLVLSDIITTDRLMEKIRTISYGIFIPIFFIIVGAETNLISLTHAYASLLLVFAIILGSVGSKFASGVLAGKLSGFSLAHSRLIGVASIPQLSTTLAVVYTAVSLGLVPQDLIAAMVLLSILTTFLGPFLIRKAATSLSSGHDSLPS